MDSLDSLDSSAGKSSPPRFSSADNMRTVQEILFQPIEGNAHLSDLEHELLALGVQPAKCALFVLRLTELLADSPKTLAQMMARTASEVKALEDAAGFSSSDSTSLRICLGCSTSPFVFKPDIVLPTLPSDEVSLAVPESALTVVPETAVKEENERSKGGALKAVGGELKHRRDPIQEYYPSATFDVEAKGNPLRSVKRLRRKIVKEFEDVCGDHYPTKEERDIILSAIQALCGPPDNSPSWNYYYTTEGNRKVKHKGTAICDLERARRAPALWGCHGTAQDGQLRPARPVRPRPMDCALAGAATPIPPTFGYLRAPPSAGSQGGALTGGHTSQFADGDLSQLSTEAELLQQVQENEKAVKAMQEAEKAKKDAEKAAKDAIKDAKKKATKQATKETTKQAKATLRKENQGPPNPRASKRHKGEKLSPYEQERKETIENNRQWLEFIDKVQRKEVKILEKEEALAVLGSGDTFTE